MLVERGDMSVPYVKGNVCVFFVILEIYSNMENRNLHSIVFKDG